MMDKQKRWGNSAMKGHGVNSPAMMESRKTSHSKALEKAKGGKFAEHNKHNTAQRGHPLVEKVYKEHNKEMAKREYK